MKLNEIKPGDTINADEGFPCLPRGHHIVELDNGGLFVKCSHGKHYLSGQIDEDDELCGFSKVEA